MIPTFLIDAPVMVLIGILYAPFIRETAVPFYQTKVFYASLRIALVFLALVITGYVMAPDWMWMYFVPARETGAAMLLFVFVALYLLPYAGGLYLGRCVFNSGFFNSCWRAYLTGIAACIIAQAVLVISLWQRYSRVGTVEEFRAGIAQTINSAQPVSTILTGGAAVLVVIAGLQWRTFRRSELFEKNRLHRG